MLTIIVFSEALFGDCHLGKLHDKFQSFLRTETKNQDIQSTAKKKGVSQHNLKYMMNLTNNCPYVEEYYRYGFYIQASILQWFLVGLEVCNIIIGSGLKCIFCFQNFAHYHMKKAA